MEGSMRGKKRILTLIAKPGLGGHDRGSEVGVKIFYSTVGKMAVFS
jgi:methylmalonyl-CoA mutase cobalamin-binding subunit